MIKREREETIDDKDREETRLYRERKLDYTEKKETSPSKVKFTLTYESPELESPGL